MRTSDPTELFDSRPSSETDAVNSVLLEFIDNGDKTIRPMPPDMIEKLEIEKLKRRRRPQPPEQPTTN
jgi:hypothetical protein